MNNRNRIVGQKPGLQRRVQIQPPRPNIQMGTDFVQRTWGLLEGAIREIYNKNASNLSYEELYRNGYNMVLHKEGETLYKNIKLVMKERVRDLEGGTKDISEDTFLKHITLMWDDYKLATQMIRDILMYMDRNYVTGQHKLPVFELGVRVFRKIIIEQGGIGHRISRQVVELIGLERNGEAIDRLLLKKLVGMVLDLGSKSYTEIIEEPLIFATMDHYSGFSALLIQSASIPDYLRKVEEKMKEEHARVDYYLAKQTKGRLDEILRLELITKHMKTILESENSGFIKMVQEDQIQDLGRMYTLFSHQPDALKTMRDRMKAYISDIAHKYVEDKEKLKEPKMFIQGIVDLKTKYDNIVTISFLEDREFKFALQSALEEYVNLSARTAEFLSLYIDDKLRRGVKGLSEVDVEFTLDQAMNIFRYMQDKDIFEKYYKIHLSRRLLSSQSASIDSEKIFITKLKAECGFQFTSKLEGMFNDMRTSEDTMKAFKEADARNSQNLGMELKVNVLTTGFWPAYSVSECVLPRELKMCCDVFTDHYNRAHNGRKLMWQTNMGDGLMIGNFQRRHELVVTTYQMVILALFNKYHELSFKDIQDLTKIPEKELKRNLFSLSAPKHKILNRALPKSSPVTSNSGSSSSSSNNSNNNNNNNNAASNSLSTSNSGQRDIVNTEMFSYNPDFTSNNIRVKISVVAVKETEEETQETHKRINQDRKPQIEAAIVRVMKSRKILHHNQLLEEVVKQLQSRFTPSPSDIKKRIESLIEREFLERDSKDRKLYKYLA